MKYFATTTIKPPCSKKCLGCKKEMDCRRYSISIFFPFSLFENIKFLTFFRVAFFDCFIGRILKLIPAIIQPILHNYVKPSSPDKKKKITQEQSRVKL